MVQQQHKTINQEDLSLARQRSQSYWFVAGLFLHRPDEEFLESLADNFAQADQAALANNDAMMRLQSCLQLTDLSQLSTQLGVEYTRLLRGIKQGYGPPPPYESLYRENRLMGEATLAVIRHYQLAGYSELEESVGPQDHIGAELRFMALLCHDEADARLQANATEAAKIRTAQITFLERHLLAWVPDYCDRLQQETREPFYGAVAGLTAELLAEDHMLLQTLPAST
ncbi:MAG TPA: hypothetical protein ENG78_02300 [Acidiferrobacteraceae bacterium]|nr:hypothetical protein [Acidiferrobacteraceae bacterium]HEX19639.1 hypothetical protein [Acidiferrobacteraceae bacterium]